MRRELQLLDLQFRIHQHDQRYNPNIGIMSQQEKVKHFALRFGRMSSTLPTDYGDTNEDACELLHAVLSLANYLNMSISAHVTKTPSLALTGSVFNGPVDHYAMAAPVRNLLDIKLDHIGRAGDIAKVAEALDHLEPLEFRRSVEGLVLEFFVLAMQLFRRAEEHHNVTNSLAMWLNDREEKSIFVGHYGYFGTGKESEYKPL